VPFFRPPPPSLPCRPWERRVSGRTACSTDGRPRAGITRITGAAGAIPDNHHHPSRSSSSFFCVLCLVVALFFPSLNRPHSLTKPEDAALQSRRSLCPMLIFFMACSGALPVFHFGHTRHAQAQLALPAHPGREIRTVQFTA